MDAETVPIAVLFLSSFGSSQNVALDRVKATAADLLASAGPYVSHHPLLLSLSGRRRILKVSLASFAAAFKPSSSSKYLADT